MLKSGSEVREMDLRIQWSLITRIKAAATVYKSAAVAGNVESLNGYLSALENLAEYVATRCRGSALFEEGQAAGQPEPAVERPATGKKRGPKLIPFTPSVEGAAFVAVAGDVSCESLAG
jgi:hypothetical protein